MYKYVRLSVSPSVRLYVRIKMAQALIRQQQQRWTREQLTFLARLLLSGL